MKHSYPVKKKYYVQVKIIQIRVLAIHTHHRL